MSSNEERLEELLLAAQGTILEQEAFIVRLLSQPLAYATVVEAQNEFNLKAFEQNDLMLITDQEWRRKNEKSPTFGKIVSKGVDKDGNVALQLPNGVTEKFAIGLKGVPQVKLLGKNDGTNCVIVFRGERLEVLQATV